MMRTIRFQFFFRYAFNDIWLLFVLWIIVCFINRIITMMIMIVIILMMMFSWRWEWWRWQQWFFIFIVIIIFIIMFFFLMMISFDLPIWWTWLWWTLFWLFWLYSLPLCFNLLCKLELRKKFTFFLWSF